MPLTYQIRLSTQTLWTSLGFGSSIVGFSCFPLSSTFQKLFGQRNWLKIILYCTVSFILSVLVLFVKPISPRFSRVLRWKTRVGFLVLLLTSFYSYYEGLIKEGQTEERVYRKILSLISFGAFVLASMSVSALAKLRFEVGVSTFFVGCLIVELFEINAAIAACFAISCYVGLLIHSCLNSHSELRSGGADTLHISINIPPLFHNETQGSRNSDQETDDTDVDTVFSSFSREEFSSLHHRIN